MGTLHLVATPIGNLEDVTLRSVRVLREADLVLAEDTRRTRKLLDRCAIPARPLSLHAHNEAARVAKALDVLSEGGSVALVSDAGTPLISDPGERLVAAAIAADHRVVPVPGASAVLAALSVAGLPLTPFAFLGFLPRKAGARRALLESYRGRPETLVFFESPQRISSALRDLAETLGDRPACVARELTKLHEEVVRGSLGELAEGFDGGVRGEVTIVVGGASAAEGARDVADLDDAIRERIAAGRSSREIAAELARDAGLSRREVYARVVALREEGSPEPLS
jgi:16S rRNA (cytidine1402-2'-O)-methyltransferase